MPTGQMKNHSSGPLFLISDIPYSKWDLCRFMPDRGEGRSYMISSGRTRP